MKIRDLWGPVSENRAKPCRCSSALTNRPEVNVLDRLWIAFPQTRISPLVPCSGKKKTFDPFDTRISYQKFACVSLQRQTLSMKLKLFLF